MISMEDAIKKFDVEHVGKSPSRFDFDKLNHINGIYLRKKSADEIIKAAEPFLQKKYGDKSLDVVKNMAHAIAERSQTLEDFATNSAFILPACHIQKKRQKCSSRAGSILPLLLTYSAIYPIGMLRR
jgi:glutamyl-tRNA synthetase